METKKALQVVNVPSVKEPIMKSPGFQKKLLADRHLELMALCGFGCRYCSSNSGNYLRINRGRFADLTAKQLGVRLLPATSPELTFRWPDILDKLEAQLATKRPTWGAGETLILSQLTDAFSPLAIAREGDAPSLAERVLRLLLERTKFRLRILTKGAAVASERFLAIFREHHGRVLVGLSIGTLDDGWARRVEIGTSSPSARLRAHRALLDAGVPVFGMLCPIFPDQVERLDDLLDAVRPAECVELFAEPYNDRANWRAVRAGYEEGSAGWTWMTRVYGEGDRAMWSRYATELYQRLRARRDLDPKKLRYLLYEDQIAERDAAAFAGFEGVLLQTKKREDGYSQNPAIARLQRRPGDGCATVEARP